MDHLVHSWDVAKGSGQDATLDEELVEICIPFAAQVIAAVGQGKAFGYTQEYAPPPVIQRRSVCSPSSVAATTGLPPATITRRALPRVAGCLRSIGQRR